MPCDRCVLNKKGFQRKQRKRKSEPEGLPEIKNKIETQIQNLPANGQVNLASSAKRVWLHISIFIVVGTKSESQRRNKDCIFFFHGIDERANRSKPKSFFFIIVIDALLVVWSQFISCLLSCPLHETKKCLPVEKEKKTIHSSTRKHTHRERETHLMACNNHKNTGLARLQLQKKLPKEMLLKCAHLVKRWYAIKVQHRLSFQLHRVKI